MYGLFARSIAFFIEESEIANERPSNANNARCISAAADTIVAPAYAAPNAATLRDRRLAQQNLVAITASPALDLRAANVLTLLREATRSAHARVESSQQMQRLMSHAYTPLEYRRHLCCMLGFYEPLEAALAQAGAGAHTPISPSRCRLLERDLYNLGVESAQIRTLPRCADLPRLSAAGLLGSVYVYEGAALGGKSFRAG